MCEKNESGATQGVEVLMDKLREGEDDQSNEVSVPTDAEQGRSR